MLVWTKSGSAADGADCAVDLVELPRLRLTFTAGMNSLGQWCLYSNDQSGYFISERRSEELLRLLKGARCPHSLRRLDAANCAQACRTASCWRTQTPSRCSGGCS